MFLRLLHHSILSLCALFVRIVSLLEHGPVVIAVASYRDVFFCSILSARLLWFHFMCMLVFRLNTMFVAVTSPFARCMTIDANTRHGTFYICVHLNTVACMNLQVNTCSK